MSSVDVGVPWVQAGRSPFSWFAVDSKYILVGRDEVEEDTNPLSTSQTGMTRFGNMLGD